MLPKERPPFITVALCSAPLQKLELLDFFHDGAIQCALVRSPITDMFLLN